VTTIADVNAVVNINDIVFVKLTEYGERILKQSGATFKDGWFNCKMPDGYYRMVLWEFMSIFGSSCYCGSKLMIVENSLHIVVERCDCK
jgi:hypothetical protein